MSRRAEFATYPAGPPHGSAGRCLRLLALATLLLQLVLPVTGPAQAAASPAAAPAVAPPLAYGVYDPGGTFRDFSGISIEHIYIPLLDLDLPSLDRAYNYAHARNRSLLITLEPRSWSPRWTMWPPAVKNSILAGLFDPEITAVCGKLATFAAPVTIRWAHEMDVANGRYPWSSWAPADYIAAYHHFVDACRALAPRVKYMWSPRGESDLRRFYPGDAYVDEIGLTIVDLQQYDLDTIGRSVGFAERLSPAYDLVAPYGKPVVVAELAFTGDTTFEAAWQDEIIGAAAEFPLLVGIVYFNAIEPYPWPAPYGHPDWRITADRLATLEKLK